MGLTAVLIVAVLVLVCVAQTKANHGETVLSSILTPDNLSRQGRSYYDRYEDRPRCGRCDDDEDDDRDRDDDRRSNRPTYGNRNDRNKNYDDDNRNYDDRKNKNGTDDEDDKKRQDDRDRPNKRNKNRHRYDDRDRYRPDYYDRFLRDPYRSQYDRPYDDPYLRRPGYERYPYPDRYDNGYGRYDDYSYRRPYSDDRYDRGGYDRYGGYGPGVGRGAHDSFRPWDETYRGQAGWDDGGRGYYFASGRPDNTNWAQRDSARPVSSGWQNAGYNTYRDPGYSGSYGGGAAAGGYQDVGYGGGGYGQSGQSSGWRNVGYTNRPYRDQSGVTQLDNRKVPDVRYGQNRQTNYGQQTYPQVSSNTTPGTSYLYQREDEGVTKIEPTDPPSPQT